MGKQFGVDSNGREFIQTQAFTLENLAAAKFQTLTVGRDDTLVVQFPGRISLENCGEIKARLEEKFPGRRIMVTGDEINLTVVRCP